MLLPVVASADAVEIGGIYYNLNSTDKTAEVTSKPDRYSGAVEIPASVVNPSDDETYAVTSIGEKAFYNCQDLTNLTIPNSVTSIGELAFWNCKGLTSLTITIINDVIPIRNYSAPPWYEYLSCCRTTVRQVLIPWGC